MRPYRIHRFLTAAVILAGTGTLLAQNAPTSSLAAQDAEYRKLYQQVNSSIVRVTVVQDAMAIVKNEGLTDKYEAWLKTAPDRNDRSGRPRAEGRTPTMGQGGSPNRPDFSGPNNGFSRGGPGGFGGGPSGPGGMGGSMGGGMGGGGMGGGFGGRSSGTGNVAFQVGSFYVDQAYQAQKENKPDLAAHYRAQALRVQMNPTGFQGDKLAVALDDQGYALLLGGVFRETQSSGSPMTVATSAGTKIDATFVGANVYAGFTVIKLSDPKAASPASWSRHKLAPGQTLLPVTFGQPFAPLVHVQPHLGEPFSEDHLSPDDQTTPRFERGGALLFDVEGHLAAVVTAGGGWAAERFALSGTRMQRDIAYIIDKKTDIEPRALGVEFTNPNPATRPVTTTTPGRIVGTQRAVQVKAVAPKSLAEKAGLKEGDLLLSIDGRHMSDFVTVGGQALPGLIQLQVDLVTRSGEVPLHIMRDGKEQTLQMPLK